VLARNTMKVANQLLTSIQKDIEESRHAIAQKNSMTRNLEEYNRELMSKLTLAHVIHIILLPFPLRCYIYV
jgi:hypothetical protein